MTTPAPGLAQDAIVIFGQSPYNWALDLSLAGAGPGCTLSLAPGGAPAHGTLTIRAGGLATFRTATGFVGTDHFVYAATGADGAVTTATVTVRVLVDTTENPMPLILQGGDGHDLLVAGYRGETLLGAGGSDTLCGGYGGDTLFGGDGNDVLMAGLSFSPILSENALNALYGGDGDDVLWARGGSFFDLGAETVDGGAGNDEYHLNVTGMPLIAEAPDGGIDTLVGADAVLPPNVENFRTMLGQKAVALGNGLANTMSGGIIDDRLEGRGGDDTLYGGTGNDTLLGGAGADRLVGGKGADLYLPDLLDVIVERDGGGTDTLRANGSWTLPDGVEVLELAGTDGWSGTGNGMGNRLLGNGGANTLRGLAGNDRLEGGAGADLLRGGAGFDRLLGGDGNDRLEGGAGADSLDGQGGRDTLVGGDGNDRLAGTAGDRLEGGAGDDTYAGPGDATVVEAPGGGIDRLLLTMRTGAATMAAGVEEARTEVVAARITVTGNGLDNRMTAALYVDSVTFRGGDGNDTLVVNGGENVLDGGRGADRMMGGSASDTFVVDTLSDVVIDRGALTGDNRDLVVASVTWTLGSSFEDLDLVGRGNLAGTGTWLSNGMAGNAGANLLRGLAGQDQLYGEGGADRLYAGEGDDFATGDAGNDSVFGGAGDDDLYGATGDDLVYGGAGRDVLSGGLGRNQLWGGDGADGFYYEMGQDRIRDFDPVEDVLVVPRALWGGRIPTQPEVMAHAQVIGGTVIFDFGSGRVMTVEGISDLDDVSGRLAWF